MQVREFKEQRRDAAENKGPLTDSRKQEVGRDARNSVFGSARASVRYRL